MTTDDEKKIQRPRPDHVPEPLVEGERKHYTRPSAPLDQLIPEKPKPKEK
ncbi:MAG TPA: hypothetical protein VEL07_13830 [Planctomycetota bacterium]|nr:hypothetical protein [Planctomycetota bacterium]